MRMFFNDYAPSADVGKGNKPETKTPSKTYLINNSLSYLYKLISLDQANRF
jgi:hypothetical protein